jgi:hypothetical protein
VLEVAAYKWYTTFAIEPGLSQTTIAGTLAAIGPFKLCDIVHPNIRAFRQWYRRRRAEVADQARQYRERERQIEAEWATRRNQWQTVGVARADQADDFDPFLDL